MEDEYTREMYMDDIADSFTNEDCLKWFGVPLDSIENHSVWNYALEYAYSQHLAAAEADNCLP